MLQYSCAVNNLRLVLKILYWSLVSKHFATPFVKKAISAQRPNGKDTLFLMHHILVTFFPRIKILPVNDSQCPIIRVKLTNISGPEPFRSIIWIRDKIVLRRTFEFIISRGDHWAPNHNFAPWPVTRLVQD